MGCSFSGLFSYTICAFFRPALLIFFLLGNNSIEGRNFPLQRLAARSGFSMDLHHFQAQVSNHVFDIHECLESNDKILQLELQEIIMEPLQDCTLTGFHDKRS